MSTEAHNTGSEATEADKVNTGALGTLVAVGLFAMVAIACAVTALVRSDLHDEESAKAADANQSVIALKNQQRGILNGPAGYVDRGKGLVSLPIDTAKQLVVTELERDPNSATPPAPKAADAGVIDAADAASTSDAGAAAPAAAGDEKPQQKPQQTGKPEGTEKGAGAKPESVKDHSTVTAKPAPASSAKPSAPPAVPSAPAPSAPAPNPQH